MSDIESQLNDLTLHIDKPIKKENETLYLCKHCKWNILILVMSGGWIVITGININTIVSNNINKINTQYLIVNVCIETVTWVTYINYYITNAKLLMYMSKFLYLVLNGILSWGVLLLLDNTSSEITQGIATNVILSVWYIYFINMLHIHR